MAAAKTKKKEWLWFVSCEGHATMPVIAESWEQATVEAARLWGVRWGAVAALCELEEKRPVIRNVCCRCGTWFHGSGVVCDHCRSEAEIEERRVRAAKKNYFRRLNAGV